MSIPIRLDGSIAVPYTRSLQMGYYNVEYANGRYLAVGGVLGYPSTQGSGDGPAVTVAGASQSIDGGYTWTDVPLPFFGAKQQYWNVCYSKAAGGKWLAAARWYRGTTYNSILATSPDTPVLSFANVTAAPTNNNAVVGADSNDAGWMLGGMLNAGGYSSWTPTALPGSFDDRGYAGAPTLFSVVWTGRRFLTFTEYAMWATIPGNIAAVYAGPYAVPWGTAAAPGYVYSSASDGTRTIVTASNTRTFLGQIAPPGRRVWYTDNDGGFGAGWRNYGLLAGNESLEGICYSPKLDLFCAVGWDKTTYKSLCFIGRPGMETSFTDAGGINGWWFERLPDSVWTGVASDGEHFVAVAADGGRFVIEVPANLTR
jgi:hypothetical protein